MEQYGSDRRSFASFPDTPGKKPDEDWFDVAGDLDDFIFFDAFRWGDDDGDSRYISKR